MPNYHFISYSGIDGLDFALHLCDELQSGPPLIAAWLDKRQLHGDADWDKQIVEAIRDCDSLIFLMTRDSVEETSVCKNEWVQALKYKKPIVLVRFHADADPPFRLNSRQYVDFAHDFDTGLARLRKDLLDLAAPRGLLRALEYRLNDAQRDLRRAADPIETARISNEIDELRKQIETQQRIVDHPQAAEEQTQKNIEAGLERERKPEKPIAAKTQTKFINPPPGIAPTWYQDRYLEEVEVVKLLKDDSQRMMTIVGRGGVGKTAMVCRLLKGLESGELPDGLGAMKVEGIVYLSESGSHRVNFVNIFYDLCKLLPAETANELDAVYKNPQGSTESKMRAVLEKFTGGRVVLLLDNIEPLVDTETFAIRDTELDEALRAFLNGAHTAVNIVITTRVAPRALNLIQPGRQRVLTLDEGLESPYAENILREMDSDGRLGLKSAPADVLSRARERTRGYPRALEALFAILASDRYTTLEELLEKPTPENVVQELVGEAFNRLDTTAQKVMQALAVYNNNHVTPAAVDYLLAPHLPAIDSTPILQRLANMHFARKERGRFYLHPVDREFAYNLIPEGEKTLEKLEESDFDFDDEIDVEEDIESKEDVEDTEEELEDDGEETEDTNFDEVDFESLLRNLKQSRTDFTRYGLLDRAADFFAKARKPRAEWKKLDDIAAQLAEFELRCEAGDYDTAASVLTDISFDYLLLWGHYRLMIQMHEKVIGKINDPYLHLDNLNSLGLAYQNLGNAHKSILYFEQGIPAVQEAKDRSSEGTFLGNLGNAYADLGEARKAIEFYEQASVIAREIGDRRGEGNRLGNLGGAYADLGDAHKAIEFYEQALVITREIGDRRGEGADLGNLGNAYAALGEAHKAIELYEQALVIAREIGDRRGEGADLGRIAAYYETTGQMEKAVEYQKDSLAIRKEIGDRNGEGSSLSILGSYYSELGNYHEAKKYFEESVEIAHQTGYRYGEGFRLLNLANVEMEFENYQKAIEFALQAMKIGDEISSPDLQSNSYNSASLAHLLSNDLLAARDIIEKAETFDLPRNIFNVSALHGIIALRQGDASAARQAFTRAIAHADEILAKTPEYYDALDTKGLALCGLTVVGGQLAVVGVAEAVEIFRKARKIAPHAGVVKSVLRLFDELIKCDSEGILKDVRKAAAGEE